MDEVVGRWRGGGEGEMRRGEERGGRDGEKLKRGGGEVEERWVGGEGGGDVERDVKGV